MERRESTLLVPVLSAEPLVKNLRSKYDSSSHRGVPPHITIIYPFKNPDEINEEDTRTLRKIFSERNGFPFALHRVNAFPNIAVYLEPSERERFVNLTKEVMKAFPNYRPYEGKFKNMNPHLTLGNELGGRFSEVLEEIQKDIESKLPIPVRASEAWLMQSTNGMWSLKEKFPFLL